MLTTGMFFNRSNCVDKHWKVASFFFIKGSNTPDKDGFLDDFFYCVIKNIYLGSVNQNLRRC